MYGTLKTGFPNHHLLSNPEVGSATFIGVGKTQEPYPLVVASQFSVPFLILAKGVGKVSALDSYIKLTLASKYCLSCNS